MFKDQFQSYAITNASTMGVAQFTSLLLSKAVSHMRNVIEAIDNQDPEARYNASEKARVIIVALQDGLDHSSEKPEVKQSVGLYNGLYARLIDFLTQVNVKNDKKLAEAVIKNLQDLAKYFSELQAEVDNKAKSASAEEAKAEMPKDSDSIMMKPSPYGAGNLGSPSSAVSIRETA
jgi:flagellar biosynthetic protein FliS